MIAVPADYYLGNGIESGFELDAKVSWPLDSLCERIGC
jgi:N6-L-threonylcarbamoyladenine synthase